MNELRLQYHQETGIRIQDHNFDRKTEEYIEWLEKTIEDATKQAKVLLNHPIFYNK